MPEYKSAVVGLFRKSGKTAGEAALSHAPARVPPAAVLAHERRQLGEAPVLSALEDVGFEEDLVALGADDA